MSTHFSQWDVDVDIGSLLSSQLACLVCTFDCAPFIILTDSGCPKCCFFLVSNWHLHISMCHHECGWVHLTSCLPRSNFLTLECCLTTEVGKSVGKCVFLVPGIPNCSFLWPSVLIPHNCDNDVILDESCDGSFDSGLWWLILCAQSIRGFSSRDNTSASVMRFSMVAQTSSITLLWRLSKIRCSWNCCVLILKEVGRVK